MKIGVLTDLESAAGYHLAGLHVAVAADPEEARKVLAQMIQEDSFILIAVNESLLEDPYQTLKREMRGRDLPVLLATPSPFSAVTKKGEDAEAYVRRLVLSAIGHEIKL